ncbi:A-kinase anchor protein 1, mitochondrial-like [Myxocyprinus asiaticus]|uniref:A-kinase anchor protein 1, mitochondrial-like n=1 Tax=Myxocyprinus asiaticus TaxID=70543 RepID=UPI002222350E|nr:A-kinase anchor protein 1, mitochondrial-like [Myxocyprinus asiaticus]XP_051535798.1 A-kinase anchor protein 1, mitochondrial-like [Myxocyprinus asiaticus]XP_051535800.1 A-kinase anchor protein 1, mitochondrial-like [Myxocyprinus asiaticus]XP_051535801.1 A-kinase anchor protein 1, mitochondrial-like [Myxocyprinus asiaticus]XP_051535802.1 A-kinase anchor protein 1, mitochondrial-like [Myxocyprinus asiaticus]
MPLRFRSFVPYTLPGVLALIGWWWYISRKKERIASHDSEEGSAMGLRTSSGEGSNGIVDKGCPTESTTHRRTSQDRVKAKEQRPVEQKVVAEIDTPLLKGTSGEALGTPQVVLASGQRSASQSNTESVPRQNNPETTRQMAPVSSSTPTKTVEESPHHKAPEAATESIPSNQLPQAIDPGNTASIKKQGEKQPLNRQRSAELSKAERPEPEGEVAAETTAPTCADLTNVELASTTSSTEDQAGKLETISPKTPMSLSSFPNSTSTPLSESLSEAWHHENGELGLPAETSPDMQELQRLAAGLITEVISAATQEVMAVSSCESRHSKGSEAADSSTLAVNGREDTRDKDLCVHLENTSLKSHAETQAAQTAEEIVNGCLSPSLWKMQESYKRRAESEERGLLTMSSGEALESTPVLAKFQAEEALVEDSGCSTCQSEDGISTEDLHCTGFSSVVSESKEDLIQISGTCRVSEGHGDGLLESSALSALQESALTAENVATVCEAAQFNGTGLRNGATSEVEADQSGGSDVNSMDSVDSCSTLGMGDSQLSGSQACQSQSSELIVWEIEVPKHLVGRLIGKQGRYVSFLKQSSGAKIYISTLPYTQEFQICHIEGTQQQVNKALALIGKKFKDLDLTNLYAPPAPPLTLPSLPMTSWLLLPNGVTVEVIVVNIVSAGHVFVQQHTHPTYHALRSLDQQMFLCYSQPGTPTLPSPIEVGVICAAPAVDGAWWRAQVISFYKDSNEVEIRYVDYGGYDRVKIDALRQIRSDFVTLPFQGTEVLLDNIAPLPGEDRFSSEANSAFEELTRGVPLLAQVTNYDNNTGLPLVHMWNMVGEELVLLNRTLAERGLGTWVDSF